MEVIIRKTLNGHRRPNGCRLNWTTVDIQNKIWFCFKLLYIINLHMHGMIYLSNKITLWIPTGAVRSWLPRQQASFPIVVMLLKCISLCITRTQCSPKSAVCPDLNKVFLWHVWDQMSHSAGPQWILFVSKTGHKPHPQLDTCWVGRCAIC